MNDWDDGYEAGQARELYELRRELAEAIEDQEQAFRRGFTAGFKAAQDRPWGMLHYEREAAVKIDAAREETRR